MKAERKTKLLNFLKMQSKPLSVAEIYQASVVKELFGRVFRTIQRDIVELLAEGKIQAQGSNPAKYSSTSPLEVNLMLSPSEVRDLIKVAPEPLKKKLRQALSNPLI